MKKLEEEIQKIKKMIKTQSHDSKFISDDVLLVLQTQLVILKTLKSLIK